MKHLIIGVLLVWFTTFSLAASSEDRAHARRALMLIGEDVRFLGRIAATLDQFVKDGKMTADVAAKMKQEITADKFIDALAALHETRLTKDEIAATIAYMSVPANLALYRDMQKAHAELQGPALQARINEIQARDAQVWQAGAQYFGSATAHKIAGLTEKAQEISREQSVAAMMAAQAKVKGRP